MSSRPVEIRVRANEQVETRYEKLPGVFVLGAFPRTAAVKTPYREIGRVHAQGKERA